LNGFRQRQSEAAARSAERRRREDAAPRLKDQVPALETLRLDIQERRADAPIAESSHVRRIPVEHAPALFELPCHDAFCTEGGHDMTQIILQSLRAGETAFEGEDACNGHTGTAPCQRVLRYVATATYRRPQP
jgi:hypothetical protein